MGKLMTAIITVAMISVGVPAVVLVSLIVSGIVGLLDLTHWGSIIFGLVGLLALAMVGEAVRRKLGIKLL